MIDFNKLLLNKRKEKILTAFVIGDAMGAITDKISMPDDIKLHYKFPVTNYVIPKTNKYVTKIGGNTWRYDLISLLIKSYLQFDDNIKRIEKFNNLLKSYALSNRFKAGDGDLMLNIVISSLLGGKGNSGLIDYAVYSNYFNFIVALFSSIINDGLEYIVNFNKIIFNNSKINLYHLLRLYHLFIVDSKSLINDKISNMIIDDSYVSILFSKVLKCLECKDFESLIVKSCNDFFDLSADIVSLSASIFIMVDSKKIIPYNYIAYLHNADKKIAFIREFINHV